MYNPPCNHHHLFNYLFSPWQVASNAKSIVAQRPVEVEEDRFQHGRLSISDRGRFVSGPVSAYLGLSVLIECQVKEPASLGMGTTKPTWTDKDRFLPKPGGEPV